MVRSPIVLIAGLLAATAILPLGADAQPRGHDCKAPDTMLQMTACAQAEHEAADRELNTTYRACIQAMRYMADVPGLRISQAELPEFRLRESQRKWLAYRDANCAFYRSHSMGGTMGALNYLSCMTEMTKVRTEELRRAMQVEPEGAEGIVEGVL
jgi:uncharacterized protein YecT (DUF1311 family)